MGISGSLITRPILFRNMKTWFYSCLSNYAVYKHGRKPILILPTYIGRQVILTTFKHLTAFDNKSGFVVEKVLYIELCLQCDTLNRVIILSLFL